MFGAIGVLAALRESAKLDAAGLPYAPIMRPEQLLDDPHLKQSGGPADVLDRPVRHFDVSSTPLTDGARHATAPTRAPAQDRCRASPTSARAGVTCEDISNIVAKCSGAKPVPMS
jgi:hypothetical protein